jgi:hypothetical protein
VAAVSSHWLQISSPLCEEVAGGARRRGLLVANILPALR